MTTITRLSVLLIAAFVPLTAAAQTTDRQPTDPAAGSAAGDTGLWHVSTADVLPHGALTAALFSTRETRDHGATAASYSALSAAAGLGGRAEIFGSWQMTSEVDGHRGRGDVLTGAKLSLLSQRRGAPLALAFRGVAKLPTGDESAGASTGRVDLLTELVVGRRFGRTELTGSTGIVWRGDAAAGPLPNGIRSGVGVTTDANSRLRVFSEIHGESHRGDASGARLVSALDTPLTAAVGTSLNLGRGVSAGAVLTRALNGPGGGPGPGVAVRIGIRPGLNRPAPAPSPTAATAVPLTPVAPPTAAPAATSPSPAAAAPTRHLVFEDVHFDFDRYTLRPAALVLLDEVVAALRADETLLLRIEGHTCNIGTAEYNLALGDRRAHAVREYLVSRGIRTNRLETISFGEERPKYDNGAEPTRALNRRAEMSVTAP